MARLSFAHVYALAAYRLDRPEQDRIQLTQQHRSSQQATAKYHRRRPDVSPAITLRPLS
jgi:hypothetical protein